MVWEQQQLILGTLEQKARTSESAPSSGFLWLQRNGCLWLENPWHSEYSDTGC